MKTFFQSTIPDELLEAAQIDGCTNRRFLWSVVLPLSKTILAVMILLYAIGHWNNYFSAMLYLNEEKKYPLQIFLRDILISSQIDMTSLSGTGGNDEASGNADSYEICTDSGFFRSGIYYVPFCPEIPGKGCHDRFCQRIKIR